MDGRFAVGRLRLYRFDDVHPFGDLSPDRMPPIETGLVDDADEELRAAAVRPARRDDRRDRAAQVAGIAQLGIDQARPPAAVIGGPGRIARERITPCTMPWRTML